MNFMDAIENELNYSITENGAEGYKTTKSKLVDMNFKITSYRNCSEERIYSDFQDAFEEDSIHTLKWLFYCRDVREGLGERRAFRVIMKNMAIHYSEITNKLANLVSEYGRWDDLFVLLDTPCENTVISIIGKQLTEDIDNVDKNKSCSLLAKWLPSENTSSPQTRNIARKIRNALRFTPKQYRKILSKLRNYIDVTEVKMSANKWIDIDYERVPSKANLIYNNAFLKHDKERRTAYFEDIKQGKTKINAKVLYPHEIVHQYQRYGVVDEELELLWKNLPDIVSDMSSTIVVADGSGSMITRIGNTRVTGLEVANALAIYCSERCKGEFKDKYITFSHTPQFVDFSNCNSLARKIQVALKYDEVSNTNIKAVFDLILSTAINSNMKQEDIPSTILILSDMEFDDATKPNRWSRTDEAVIQKPNQKLFDIINNDFKNAGYKMPKLVFWNLCSRTNTIPVKENDLGVALVSGFSPNILKMVMSDKLNPYDILIETLDSPRYQQVEQCIK